MTRPENIPEEMRSLDRWVCVWEGSKIPMRAFERKGASSTRPETWSPFETALEALNAKYYDELGFVFADDGLVGIDIDCGFEEDGSMTEVCREIIDWCDSYTEVSRSGRGVHIIVRADLPFTGKNNLNGIEIYKSKRFFIITGDVIDDGHAEIEDAQEAVDKVVEKYFPEGLRDERERGVVERIYRPKWKKPSGGKVRVRPDYPEILSGGRNLSLTSLAGYMHTTGYAKDAIYRELCRVNKAVCKPPLPNRELISICESVSRYRR
jgi:hypothetical protein